MSAKTIPDDMRTNLIDHQCYFSTDEAWQGIREGQSIKGKYGRIKTMRREDGDLVYTVVLDEDGSVIDAKMHHIRVV